MRILRWCGETIGNNIDENVNSFVEEPCEAASIVGLKIRQGTGHKAATTVELRPTRQLSEEVEAGR